MSIATVFVFGVCKSATQAAELRVNRKCREMMEFLRYGTVVFGVSPPWMTLRCYTSVMTSIQRGCSLN